jgi:hypothetical protein
LTPLFRHYATPALLLLTPLSIDAIIIHAIIIHSLHFRLFIDAADAADIDISLFSLIHYFSLDIIIDIIFAIFIIHYFHYYSIFAIDIFIIIDYFD